MKTQEMKNTVELIPTNDSSSFDDPHTIVEFFPTGKPIP